MSSVAAVRVSVIVPTYNEADNVVEVIDRLRRTLRGQAHEIVIVDDDSPDGTWQRARGHGAGDPSVRVIRRIGERGLASAVLDGMSAARGDALAVMDGDLQHDESVLPDMVRSVLDDGADVCVGVRRGWQGPSGDRARWRRWVTAAGAALARRVLPLLRRTSDPLSGFFVVSRGAYEGAAPPINRNLREYKILWAFLARGRGLAVTEVGYDFRPRAGGRTKLSGSVLLDDLVNALALRLGAAVSPVLVKHCLVVAAGVAASLSLHGLGELAGLPAVSLGAAPRLSPIHLSALLGVQAGTVAYFLAVNHFILYDRRYRGWGLMGGMLLFESMSVVGVSAQLAVFQLLHQNGFLTDSAGPGAAAAISNGIGLTAAAIINFLLSIAVTRNRRNAPTPADNTN